MTSILSPRTLFNSAAFLLAFLLFPPANALTARVEPVMGRPMFVVEDKPDCGMSFMTYTPATASVNGEKVYEKYASEMAQAGCDIFTFVVDLGGVYGYSPTIWPEPDRWDFAYLDASGEAILKAAGPEARIIVQLYIDAPAWWIEQHPDDRLRFEDGGDRYPEKYFALPHPGPFASIASEAWRTDMKRAMDALIEHVDASAYGGRVMGYQICGQKTEEWYHWSMNAPQLGDYSAPMLARFRDWLRARYQTDEALRRAWHKDDVTFDTAAIPAQAERFGDPAQTFRDPAREQNVIDFHRFWSDIMADTIGYFAKVVKEKTNRTKVVGGFYGYLFEFAELAEDAGHLALGNLLRNPDMDFIMTPSSYHRRTLDGGQCVFRAPTLSLNLNGKLYWNDFDAASYKFFEKDQAALAPWRDQMGITNTPEEFTWMMRRELGHALATGVNMVHFDLQGGYYDDPAILDGVKECRAIRERALNHTGDKAAQILVVVDEDSLHFMGFRNPIVRKVLIEQLAELPFVAPYDTVLLSDLARVDMSPYRLVIMTNTFKLDAAQRRLISERVKCDGRTVLWLYAPGYFTEDGLPGDVNGTSEITEMKITIPKQEPLKGGGVYFHEPPLVTELGPSDGLGDTEARYISGEYFYNIDTITIPLMQGTCFEINDRSAFIFGCADVSHVGVSATKEFGDWKSIYSSVAPLPAALLRQIASYYANVHIYSDVLIYERNNADAVYTGSGFLTVSAGSDAGERTVHLPQKYSVADPATGAPVASLSDEFKITMKPHETRIFELQGPEQVAAKSDAPWYTRTLVGMEVGPTGAQFGSDPSDVGYAAQFNGADIVRKQIEAHSEYLVMWARDGEYAYYDSKITQKCPGLGARDPLREAVEAAKPLGLPVIAYCVVQGGGDALRKHPEYRMTGADGTPLDRFCYNSGYLDYMKALAAEMLAYGIDGFHIDMVDQGFGPPYGCWCENCRKRFEAEYGKPMPKGVTWDDDWDRMLEFRYNTSDRFEHDLRDYIRAIAPNATVDFNYHGSPPFSFEVGQRPVQHADNADFVTGETGIWGFSALGVSLNAEFYQAATPGQPYQVAMQRGVRMYHDQTARPLNDLRWEMFTLLAHGAQVTVVDKTPYNGTLDPVTYDRLGKLFAEVHAKRDTFRHTPLREVGLYYSSRSRDWYGREEPSKYMQPFYGAQRALVYEHIQFGVLLDENRSIETLRQYPVVLLPNTPILSEKEVTLFEEYVRGGGILIATGITGLYDAMGAPRTTGALDDFAGVELVRILESRDNHVRFVHSDTAADPVAGDIPRDCPFLMEGPAAVFRAKDAATFGELMEPDRTVRQMQGKEGFGWPMSAKGPIGPAVFSRTVGQGKVILVSCSPDAATGGEHPIVEARKFLAGLVRWLEPAPPVRVTAPPNVETVIQRDETRQAYLVHLIGYQAPPSCTPEKNRPYVLPSLIETPPMYRAVIEVKGKSFGLVEKCNRSTALNQESSNGRMRIEATIEDIHEVIVIPCEAN